MTRIAMLGTGAMGSRMAARLLEDGFGLTVYNRTAARSRPLLEQGAQPADSPREAVCEADVVISMVADDPASRAVWLDSETGAIEGMRDGALAVESSTLTAGWARQLAAELGQRGVRFVDAPVVGSRPQAEAGALIYLAGGEACDVDELRPVLEPMAAVVHHLGAVGNGMLMKLAVNAWFGIQVAALGEVLGMIEHSDVELARAIEIFGDLPVTSPALKAVADQIGQRSFQPMFPVELVEKDFRYLLETARDLSAGTPVGETVHDLFRRAAEKGYAGDNISGVAQLFL